MDKQQISEWYRTIGKRGAQSRWDSMTPEERSKEMSRRRKLGMKKLKSKQANRSEDDE